MIEKLSKITDSADNVNIETFHSLALKIILSNSGVKYSLWNNQWEKDKTIQDICTNNKFYCNSEDVPLNDIYKMITIAKK